MQEVYTLVGEKTRAWAGPWPIIWENTVRNGLKAYSPIAKPPHRNKAPIIFIGDSCHPMTPFSGAPQVFQSRQSECLLPCCRPVLCNAIFWAYSAFACDQSSLMNGAICFSELHMRATCKLCNSPLCPAHCSAFLSASQLLAMLLNSLATPARS